jgi:hypothetical protein
VSALRVFGAACCGGPRWLPNSGDKSKGPSSYHLACHFRATGSPSLSRVTLIPTLIFWKIYAVPHQLQKILNYVFSTISTENVICLFYSLLSEGALSVAEVIYLGVFILRHCITCGRYFFIRLLFCAVSFADVKYL